ncbi:hypothetical protein NG895_14935 [Aeoliella sp. ICT_H6.2]|uniref:Uncharacterized protein n=1 Tax=Aeoliella straminimaris TaxID=2954799 RepID=A0A9X2JGN8_9BACT|nr:hypothetical protein [Aeoliella straminimaris]MCO6045205.1 hypothetical protein [Aeoliella straminimaris]
MRLEDRMYSEADTQTVIKYASHPDWHLDKAHAMYELALRALDDPSLLNTAWNCIGREIVFVTRQGTPLGMPAAAVLLEAGQDVVEKVLVEAMQDWSFEQQRSLFFGAVEKSGRRIFFDRLQANYDFVPKIEVNKDGSTS